MSSEEKITVSSSSSSSSPSLVQMESTSRALNEVKEILQPLYIHDYHTLSTEEQLNTQDNINLNISLSYSMASLFYSLLATTGEGGQASHPIRQDLEKIKKRIERFRFLKQPTGENKHPSGDSKKRKTTLNKDATARVMNKHIRLQL